MRFIYTRYDFKPPKQISEVVYQELKQRLTQDTTFEISKKESYWKKYKPHLLAFSISILGAVILIVIQSLVDSISLKHTLENVSIVPSIAVILTIGFWGVDGGISYFWYVIEKNLFFRNMKKEILKSKTYGEFLDAFYVL